MTRGPGRNDLIALAIIVALTIYGALYPFAFYLPAGGPGPVEALLKTLGTRPGRGDFLVNIAFYLPLGFFGFRVFSRRPSIVWRIAGTALIGLIVSSGTELVQYFDKGRITTVNDIYANVLGTILGAAWGAVFGGGIRWRWPAEFQFPPFPALLLGSWLGYRLYPFVPTSDVHKYWDAVKPLVLYPQLTAYGFFRYTVMWLLVAAIVEAVSSGRQSQRLFPLVAGSVLFAKILVASRFLTLEEVVGAAAAIGVWYAVRGLGPRRRALLVALPLCAYIVAWRLEPFHFGAEGRQFGWIPFYSMMYGSLEVNVQSLFEKVFFYGGMVWIAARAGLRLRTAAFAVALLLLATSVLEIYLPQRSAESTDAVLTLLVAYLATLLEPGRREAGARSPVRSRRVAPAARLRGRRIGELP